MLPNELPGTQSFFYMRLISFCYFEVQDTSIPEYIVRELNVLKELKLMSDVILKCMTDSLTSYLKDKNNMNLLTEYYKRDSSPNETNIGHINGIYQEKILEIVKLIITLENYKQNDSLYHYYDGREITVKEAFDFYLLSNYYCFLEPVKQ